MDSKQIDVMVADASHEVYVDKILDTIREAAKVRGTGIAERTHEYVATKMKEGKAIIALCGDDFAGFTYIESWGNKQYVATSGLIVHPKYRGLGLAKRIKTWNFGVDFSLFQGRLSGTLEYYIQDTKDLLLHQHRRRHPAGHGHL